MGIVATEQPYSWLSLIFNLVFVKDTKPFSTLSTNPVGCLTTLQVWWRLLAACPPSLYCTIFMLYLSGSECSGSVQHVFTACLLCFFLTLGILFTPFSHLGWIKAKWNIHSQKQWKQHKYNINSKDVYEQNKCYGISIWIVGQEANKSAFICT